MSHLSGLGTATTADPMSFFQEATRSQARLRIALIGPTGAGKSISAIRIASGLASRIAVIDTERASANKYAGWRNKHNPHEPPLKFKVLNLQRYDPRNYMAAIKLAEEAGFEAIIIDSYSHAWMGKGGALELHDAASRGSNNSFAAWRDVTPIHNDLIDAICNSPAHILATIRSKMDHVIEDNPSGPGKIVRKVGLAPVQRNDVEYEFDIVANLDVNHRMMISKTRYDEIDGLVIDRPGPEFGRTLATWLNDGESVDRVQSQAQSTGAVAPTVRAETEFMIAATIAPAEPARPVLSPEMASRITALAVEAEMTPEEWTTALAKRGVTGVDMLSPEQAAEMIERLKDRIDQIRMADRVAQGGDGNPLVPSSPLASSTGRGESEPTDSFVLPDAPRRVAPEPKSRSKTEKIGA